MIRLAISGVNESVCNETARRLRGVEQASILSGSGSDRLEAYPTGFDAVAYVGRTSPDLAEVNLAVQAGKHVLLAAETILSIDGLDAVIDRGLAAGVHVVVVNPDRMFRRAN